jgi:hypothetical protein
MTADTGLVRGLVTVLGMRDEGLDRSQTEECADSDYRDCPGRTCRFLRACSSEVISKLGCGAETKAERAP